MRDLKKLQKALEAVIKEEGFKTSDYDSDKVKQIFREQLSSEVISEFCKKNFLAFDYKLKEEFSNSYHGPSKEADMLKALQAKYPQAEKESLKQLIEALKVETPDWWTSGDYPKSPKPVKEYEAEFDKIHAKHITLKFYSDNIFPVNTKAFEAFGRLVEYLTGKNLEKYFGAGSPNHINEPLQPIEDWLNAEIGLFTVKLFKNGRIDLTIKDKKAHAALLSKIKSHYVEKHATWCGREMKERKAVTA